MFRFTIRDVLWFMVVVAFAVTWSIDRNQLRTAWHSEREEMLARWQNDREEFTNLLDRFSAAHKMSNDQRGKLADEIVSKIKAPIQ